MISRRGTLLAAGERHEEFVEMPRVALLTAPPPERSGVFPAECQAPLTDGFVGDRNASLGQQVLNIPEAESESVIEPHGVADDLGWESVAVIDRRVTAHSPTVPPAPST